MKWKIIKSILIFNKRLSQRQRLRQIYLKKVCLDFCDLVSKSRVYLKTYTFSERALNYNFSKKWRIDRFLCDSVIHSLIPVIVIWGDLGVWPSMRAVSRLHSIYCFDIEIHNRMVLIQFHIWVELGSIFHRIYTQIEHRIQCTLSVWPPILV